MMMMMIMEMTIVINMTTLIMKQIRFKNGIGLLSFFTLVFTKLLDLNISVFTAFTINRLRIMMKSER